MEDSAGKAIERELTRRGFLVGAGAGALSISTLANALAAAEALAAAAPCVAGLTPEDPAVRATMAAFADTIVPGPAGGADPHPGAIEAGALDELYDSFYSFSAIYPVIHQDLALTTPLVLGRAARFDLSLPYAERERVLLTRIVSPPDGGANPYAVAYMALGALVYLTYYGTARSRAGPNYIGFPPESDGYWPRHSYRVRFRGMTKDGNPS